MKTIWDHYWKTENTKMTQYKEIQDDYDIVGQIMQPSPVYVSYTLI